MNTQHMERHLQKAVLYMQKKIVENTQKTEFSNHSENSQQQVIPFLKSSYRIQPQDTLGEE